MCFDKPVKRFAVAALPTTVVKYADNISNPYHITGRVFVVSIRFRRLAFRQPAERPVFCIIYAGRYETALGHINFIATVRIYEVYGVVLPEVLDRHQLDTACERDRVPVSQSAHEQGEFRESARVEQSARGREVPVHRERAAGAVVQQHHVETAFLLEILVSREFKKPVADSACVHEIFHRDAPARARFDSAQDIGCGRVELLAEVVAPDARQNRAAEVHDVVARHHQVYHPAKFTVVESPDYHAGETDFYSRFGKYGECFLLYRNQVAAPCFFIDGVGKAVELQQHPSEPGIMKCVDKGAVCQLYPVGRHLDDKTHAGNSADEVGQVFAHSRFAAAQENRGKGLRPVFETRAYFADRGIAFFSRVRVREAGCAIEIAALGDIHHNCFHVADVAAAVEAARDVAIREVMVCSSCACDAAVVKTGVTGEQKVELSVAGASLADINTAAALHEFGVEHRVAFRTQAAGIAEMFFAVYRTQDKTTMKAELPALVK